MAVRFPTKKINTPELTIRNLICSWLSQFQAKGLCMFWVNDSVGIWDPTRKIYRKSNSPYKRLGVPDILGHWVVGKDATGANVARPMGLEVKTPEVKDLFGKVIQHKGRVSPDQQMFIELAKKGGWIVGVVRSIDDTRALLEAEGCIPKQVSSR